MSMFLVEVKGQTWGCNTQSKLLTSDPAHEDYGMLETPTVLNGASCTSVGYALFFTIGKYLREQTDASAEMVIGMSGVVWRETSVTFDASDVLGDLQAPSATDFELFSTRKLVILVDSSQLTSTTTTRTSGISFRGIFPMGTGITISNNRFSTDILPSIGFDVTILAPIHFNESSLLLSRVPSFMSVPAASQPFDDSGIARTFLTIRQNTIIWASVDWAAATTGGIVAAATFEAATIVIDLNTVNVSLTNPKADSGSPSSRHVAAINFDMAILTNVVAIISLNNISTYVSHPDASVAEVAMYAFGFKGTAFYKADLVISEHQVQSTFYNAHAQMVLDITIVDVTDTALRENTTLAIISNSVSCDHQGLLGASTSAAATTTPATQAGFIRLCNVSVLVGNAIQMSLNTVNINVLVGGFCTLTTYLLHSCHVALGGTIGISGDQVTKQGFSLEGANSSEFLASNCLIEGVIQVQHILWNVSISDTSDSSISFALLTSVISGTVNFTNTNTTCATASRNDLVDMPALKATVAASQLGQFDRIELTFFVIQPPANAPATVFKGTVALVQSTLLGKVRGRYIEAASIVGVTVGTGLAIGNGGRLVLENNTIQILVDNVTSTLQTDIRKNGDAIVAASALFGVRIQPLGIGSQGLLLVAKNVIHVTVYYVCVRSISAITTDSNEVLGPNGELSTQNHQYLYRGGSFLIDDNEIRFLLEGIERDSLAAIPSPPPLRYTTFRRHSISLFGFTIDSTTSLPNSEAAYDGTTETILLIRSVEMEFHMFSVEVLFWSMPEKAASLPFWSGIYLPQAKITGSDAVVNIADSTCSFAMDAISSDTDEYPYAADFFIPLTYFDGLHMSQGARFEMTGNVLTVDIAFSLYTVLGLYGSDVSCRLLAAVLSSMRFITFSTSMVLEVASVVSLQDNMFRIKSEFIPESAVTDPTIILKYPIALKYVESRFSEIFQNITLRLPTPDTLGPRPSSSFLYFNGVKLSGGSSVAISGLTVNLTMNLYAAAVVLFNGTDVTVEGGSAMHIEAININGRFRSAILFECHQRPFDSSVQAIRISEGSSMGFRNSVFILPTAYPYYEGSNDETSIVSIRGARAAFTGRNYPKEPVFSIANWTVSRFVGAQSIFKHSVLHPSIGALSVHAMYLEASSIHSTGGGSIGISDIDTTLTMPPLPDGTNPQLGTPEDAQLDSNSIYPLYYGLTINGSSVRLVDGSQLWIRGITVSCAACTKEIIAVSLLGTLNGTLDATPSAPLKAGSIEVSDCMVQVSAARDSRTQPTGILPLSVLSADSTTTNAYLGRLQLCNSSINGKYDEIKIPESVAKMAALPLMGNEWGLHWDLSPVCLRNESLTATLAIPRTATYTVAIPEPVEPSPMEIYREQSERVLTALLIAGGGLVSATSSGQASVAMAIIRVARCVDDEASTEDGDDSEDEGDGDSDVSLGDLGEPLSPFIHPLGFSVGAGDYKFYIGAILGNCLIIPFLAFLLLRFLLPHALQRWVLPADTDMPKVLNYIGYPSVLIVPFVTLAEGIAAAATELVRSGKAAEALVGILGGGILLAVVGAWAHVLLMRLYKLPIRLEKAPFEGYVSLAFGPMYDWAPKDLDSDKEDTEDEVEKEENAANEEADEELERMGNFIGGKVFLCADGIALLLTVMVGIVEGIGKGVACHSSVLTLAVFGIIQSLLACTTTCPTEFLVQFLIAICITMLAVSSSRAGLKGPNDTLFSEDIEQTIGFSVNILGFFGLGLGVTCALVNLAQQKELLEMLAKVVAAGGRGVAVSLRVLRRRRRLGYYDKLEVKSASTKTKRFTLSEMDKFMGKIHSDVEMQSRKRLAEEQAQHRDSLADGPNVSFSTAKRSSSNATIVNAHAAPPPPPPAKKVPQPTPPRKMREEEAAIALLRSFEAALLSSSDEDNSSEDIPVRK